MPIVLGGPYKGGYFGDSSIEIVASGTLTEGLSVPQQADWVERSTAPGVLWAHDFSESDNELEYFVRISGNTNPDPATLPNPLTLTTTTLGSSRAIRSRAVGTLITQNIAAIAKGSQQTISVGDSSRFPDPAGVGGSYGIFFGCTDKTAQDTVLSGEVIEVLTLVSRDTGANTITVNRTVESHNYRVDGIDYSTSSPNAPSVEGASGNYTVGFTNSGSWNRPLCCFPAGEQGKAADDNGITSGAAAKTRTWNPTRGGTGHAYFREGYFGSRYYWDPAVNPAAPYKDWTPNWSGDGQNFPHPDAFEGDEFYLQFRFKVSEARLNSTISKLMFIQNAAVSGAGQMFLSVGVPKYNEQPDPADKVAGTTSGNFMMMFAGGADGRQPAGGYFGNDTQTNGFDFPGTGPASRWQTDYPLANYDNRLDTDCYAFCHQSETWITAQVHFKAGRDNAEQHHPAGVGTDGYAVAYSPFPGVSDSSYQTVLGIEVALPGDTAYRTLTDINDAMWFFGDNLGEVGNLVYNPPAINAFWMTLEFNMYFGSGSIAPPDGDAEAQFTQAILSRDPVPLPIVIPEYVPETPGEVAALTVVSNGVTTLRAAAGAAWQADPSLQAPPGGSFESQHLSGITDFSGGFGDQAARSCYAHGGGHGDSAYNGIIGFDFNGTTSPTGFSLLAGSESPDPQDWNNSNTFTNGRPAAIHSYDQIVYNESTRTMYRMGGSIWSGSGGATGLDYAFDVDAGTWSDVTGSGRVFMDNGHASAYDPVTNKAWFGKSITGRIWDIEGDNWSGATPSHGGNFHHTGLYVPTLGRIYCFGKGNHSWATVDWAAETVGSFNGFTPTGTAGWTTDEGWGCVWDELLEVIWIFSGRVNPSAFYRYDPVTNVSSQLTLSGDSISVAGANAYFGIYKRFVYIPEWRAIGFITTQTDPAYIVKLPSS